MKRKWNEMVLMKITELQEDIDLIRIVRVLKSLTDITDEEEDPPESLAKKSAPVLVQLLKEKKNLLKNKSLPNHHPLPKSHQRCRQKRPKNKRSRRLNLSRNRVRITTSVMEMEKRDLNSYATQVN